MPDNKKTTRTFYIKLLYFYLVFVFLTFSWMFFHEIAHFSACEVLGYDGKITFDKFVAMTNCEGITNSTIVGIFFYITMPYLMDLLIFIPIFWLLYIKNIKTDDALLRVLPYVLAVDVGYNFIGSLYKQSDFTVVLSLLKTQWYLSLIPVFIIIFCATLISVKDLKALVRSRKS